MARIPREELESLFVGYGYKPYWVEGSDPADVHQQMAGTMDAVDRRDQADPARRARERRTRERPAWPMIVMQDAEGLDRPEGGRRPEDRGLLALAPGPDGRDGAEARSTSRCSRTG